MCGGGGTWGGQSGVRVGSVTDGPGRGIRTAPQALSSEPRVGVGRKQAQPGGPAWMCLFWGWHKRSPEELPDRTDRRQREPSTGNCLDRGVPIMVYVCKLHSPGNPPV